MTDNLQDTDADADALFDMEAWAIEHKLNRKTTGTLRREEFEGLDALKLVTSSDINRMDIGVGQIRVLRKALQALGNPIKVNDSAEEEEETDAGQAVEDDEGAIGQDNNEGILNEAGDQLAQLLQQGDLEDPLDIPVRTVAALKQKPRRTGGAPPSYAQYDPLMHLTVKAGNKKALQIEQFLPEAVKTRVNRKKREQLTFTTTPQGGLTLKNDEHGSIYLTVAEWNGANVRLCSHMLNTGLIKEKELIYYMAYTAMISDLAGRYEWASILEYDRRYRELQAEHGFLWGTPHPHTEMHVDSPMGGCPLEEQAPHF